MENGLTALGLVVTAKSQIDHEIQNCNLSEPDSFPNARTRGIESSKSLKPSYNISIIILFKKLNIIFGRLK
jgi:hypothetical protein